MTPSARLAAAAEVLDTVLKGTPAEKALTNWARRSRYAGSGDRAAIRDHVFDALRRRRSAAAMGGAETGRGLVIGLLRQDGLSLDHFLTGERFALDPIGPREVPEPGELSPAVLADVPDWLWPVLNHDLGPNAAHVLEALRRRAPLFLRANLARSTRQEAQDGLAKEGVEARAHPKVASALEVTSGARRVHQTTAYQEGLVEIQDAHSQALVTSLGELAGTRVLDFCAGGGGKSLAMAALGAQVTAHDAFPERMKDLKVRAARAGASVKIAPSPSSLNGPFDLVVADVPCSGSGAWRRQAEAKWTLTAEKLDSLRQTQSDILTQCQDHVRPGGRLALMTCSILKAENDDLAQFFADQSGWTMVERQTWLPSTQGDGFFLAIFTRSG